MSALIQVLVYCFLFAVSVASISMAGTALSRSTTVIGPVGTTFPVTDSVFKVLGSTAGAGNLTTDLSGIVAGGNMKLSMQSTNPTTTIVFPAPTGTTDVAVYQGSPQTLTFKTLAEPNLQRPLLSGPSLALSRVVTNLPGQVNITGLWGNDSTGVIIASLTSYVPTTVFTLTLTFSVQYPAGFFRIVPQITPSYTAAKLGPCGISSVSSSTTFVITQGIVDTTQATSLNLYYYYNIFQYGL